MFASVVANAPARLILDGRLNGDGDLRRLQAEVPAAMAGPAYYGFFDFEAESDAAGRQLLDIRRRGSGPTAPRPSTSPTWSGWSPTDATDSLSTCAACGRWGVEDAVP